MSSRNCLFVLGFSENLQQASVTPASEFTVTADGSAVRVGGV